MQIKQSKEQKGTHGIMKRYITPPFHKPTSYVMKHAFVQIRNNEHSQFFFKRTTRNQQKDIPAKESRDFKGKSRGNPKPSCSLESKDDCDQALMTFAAKHFIRDKYCITPFPFKHNSVYINLCISNPRQTRSHH